jgi:hypothetical protein
MLLGMPAIFSEFERVMIRGRVMAGENRARASAAPRATLYKIGRIRAALDEWRGVRETAQLAWSWHWLL